ncbi:MAG: nicotinate (nicotinamide) nucleotide adenylyltransferase [Prevotellaceae bacterium]|nr:nicotinate-nucleotide adenylyltransferase [Prevotella sp.]MDD7257831.1 nicotinate (nicotinamide) nucleotide adenylyltransferase [Prevotellaceae bacterium]MDY6131564.1 nicotinate (nicotinamide) nucleotide adenylyltransferase [Prevotella sp.]
MIRTGIFGGSFNPIHNGHIALARQMLKAAPIDEIWFMVSPLNPLKKESSDLLDDDLRLKMVQMALQDEKRLVACDYEFRLPIPSYTWNTLQSLSHDYPERQFILLIGADNWEAFPQWSNHRQILEKYPIVIYPREGSSIDSTLLPHNVYLIETELFHTSSTDIRQRIRKGESVAHLIPPAVAQIIKENGWYKGE